RQSEPVDLNAVVAESLRALKERLGGGRVRVVERLSRDLPPVAAEAVLLEGAVGGLVENALDGVGDDGTLAPTTAVGGGRVVLDVGDTGPGIPAAHVDRVFDLFYTTKTQGTGLGLSLARKFIEGFGGTLTVTTRPGEGAVFRVCLPVAGAWPWD